MKKDVNRWTILHWAAFGNNHVVIKKLINRCVRQLKLASSDDDPTKSHVWDNIEIC